MRRAFLIHLLGFFGRGEWSQYTNSERDLGEMQAPNFFENCVRRAFLIHLLGFFGRGEW